MISSISSQAAVHPPPQTAKAQPAQPPKPSQKADSVQISAQAKAALASKDVDHDSDSH